MKDKIRDILEWCAVDMGIYFHASNFDKAVEDIYALFAELEKDRERLDYLCNNTISIVIGGATVTGGTYIDRDVIDRAMEAEAARKETSNK